MGRCCCCSKEIDYWDSNQLADGEICTECYNIVLTADNELDKLKLSKRKCDDIRLLYHTGCETKKANPEAPQGDFPETDSNVSHAETTEKSSKGSWKPFSVFCEIVVVCVALYLWISGSYVNIFMDIAAEFSNDPAENPYIQMVAAATPDGMSQSYGKAFANSFSSNLWTYFKSNGTRVVQVRSRYDDIDEELITQFTLTPTDTPGMFWIELYAMKLNGQNLSEMECSILMAGIFKDDLMNAFADLIISNMLG